MTLDPKRIAMQGRNPRTPDPNEFSFAQNNDSNSSLNTLMENLSSTSLTPTPEPLPDIGVYNLPTHISSHYDVLNDLPRTQPGTPLPYQEPASHPMRALTSDNISMRRNGELLSPSPVHKPYDDNDSLIIDTDEEESISEEARILNSRKRRSWDDKGAAELTRKNSNGQNETIRKSVKDFIFGKTLGVGSYSTVLLATDKKTQRQFAVKVLDKRHIIREKKVKYVNIEKNTLKRLGKRNGIVHMFFAFQDETSLYFVLDYAANGELLNLIKEHGSINEECVRYYGAQILDAIKFMHDNGVVHRDLKPENILLDSKMKTQITDFGTAKLLEKNEKGKYPPDIRAKSFVGTAEYVSPELLNEKSIGKSCDIWAYGCIIYQLIAGKPPFKATNEYLTFQKIVKLQYAFTAGFPMVIRDLVKRILKLNPKDRLTIKEIQEHHFFQGLDFKNPEESIWNVDPPEITPYKVSAKSMLPVPELANKKTRLTIPRRTQSGNTPTTPKSESGSSITDEELSVQSNISNSGEQQDNPTASQLVLMKAQATVAARKKQQQSKKADAKKRAVSAGSAANAASVALSRPPNEIMKSYKPKKRHDSTLQVNTETVTPPVSSSSKVTDESATSSVPPRKPPSYAPPINPQSASKLIVRSALEPQTMTKLDLEFINELKFHDERVLSKDEFNVTLSSVDLVEKKFRGKLVDSPLGGNSGKSSTSLLSQVANGSYSGLRNISQHGAESEKNVIRNHGVSNDPNSHKISDQTKNRFRRLFSSNSPDDNNNNKRNRTLIITNYGRLLIYDFNSDSAKLELKTEISVSHPVIRIKEVIQSSASPVADGIFIVESYNSAFIFEGQQAKVTSWCNVIHKARQCVTERAAVKKLENDPGGDAGTVLGSDAAKSAANIATVHSPSLNASTSFKDKLPSPVEVTLEKLTSDEPEIQSPRSSSSKKGIFQEMVRSKTASRSSISKELPSNGHLYHGLPFYASKDQNGEGQVDSMIAAASAAALSAQHLPTPLTSNQRTSSFNEKTYGNMLTQSNHQQPTSKVTGMTSRMLSRTKRKK